MDLLIERKVIPKNKAGTFFLGYGNWGRSKPLSLSSKLTSVGVRPHSTLILNMRILGGSHPMQRMISYVDVPPHHYSTPLKNITLASLSLNNVNTSPSPSFCSLFDDNPFDNPPTSSSSKRKCTTDADSDNNDTPYYHSSSSSCESSLNNVTTADLDTATPSSLNIANSNTGIGSSSSKRKCPTASDNDVDDYFPQKKRLLSVSVNNDSEADDNLPFDGQESYQMNDQQNSGGKITAFNRPDGKWVCYCSSHPKPHCYENKSTLWAHYTRASKKYKNLKWKVSNT